MASLKILWFLPVYPPGQGGRITYRHYPRARKKGVDARLLIIPRHSERRKQIIKTLQSTALPYHVRTDQKQAPEGTIIYLADTTGELGELIHAADLGWMGKTLSPNQ